MCVCVSMNASVCCEVRVKSHKCFPWLLRHRKRGSGILCGNILWLKVVFLTDGTEGQVGVECLSNPTRLIGVEQSGRPPKD